MLYSYDLTIPVNTPKGTPLELEAPLTHGVIERVEIQFPSGCAGLVGVQAWYREHQLYPTNTGAWFVTDGYVITWDDGYELVSLPYALRLKGYNLDDTYPHTITFRFDVGRVEDTLASKVGRLFRPTNVPEIAV